MPIPTSAKSLENPYQYNLAELKQTEEQTSDTKLYTFRYIDDKQQGEFSFNAGQYMLLSVFGFGEAPFGICSSPSKTTDIQLTIRKVGHLTNALDKLSVGSHVGLRGPYGNGWPMNELLGKDVVLIAGGMGLVPLRPVILEVLENRDNFGKLQILFGARCPDELLYKDELYLWGNRRDVEYVATVDRDDEHCWAGNIGVVTTLFDRLTISAKNAIACVCGPPIMYRFVIRDLHNLHFTDDQIYLSLERRMKCGVGHCSHCIVGTKFVCQDGPVFRYDEAKNLRGAV
ncbi:MAG: FAD/NAD(P)-binding protein [Promethearchaeota archaeon]